MNARARNKITEIVEGLTRLRDSYIAVEPLLAAGPSHFWFNQINEYVEGLFTFAKFRIGDRVALTKDIDCNNSPGWLACEHFLKQGATAVVDDCDYRKGRFVYGVVFDNETWIDKDKVVRSVSSKHQFWFSESQLQPRK